MSLVTRVKDEFDPGDWSKGEAYFRSGAVSLQRRYDTGIVAAVQGSERKPYDVGLDWSEANYETLLIYCSCPRFADTECCKHVAATVMAVSALPSVKIPGKRKLRLEALEAPEDREAPDEEFDDEDDAPPRFAGPTAPVALPNKARQANASNWKQRVAEWGRMPASLSGPLDARTKPRQIWYVLDLLQTGHRGLPAVVFYQRTIKSDGTLGKLKTARISREEIDEQASEEDRRLLGILFGNETDTDGGYQDRYGYDYDDFSDCYVVPAMFDIVLPRLCASGRFGWLQQTAGGQSFTPLSWDDGPAWKSTLDIGKDAAGEHWIVSGKLVRGGETLDLSSTLLILAYGLAIFPNHLARFDSGGDFRWPAMLKQGPLVVPIAQQQEFIESLATQLPPPTDAQWPAELSWQETQGVPRPRLKITPPKRSWQKDLDCQLSFQYGDKIVPFDDKKLAWYDRQSRTVLRRDQSAEVTAGDRMLAAGVEFRAYRTGDQPSPFYLAPARLSRVVAQLVAAGWHVEAEGHRIRQAKKMSISVQSGVDWFDLDGVCDFDGVQASLPQLLAALDRGEQYISFSDGSQGLLPEQWLARFAPLARFGQVDDDQIRFLPTQAALLDALLAAQENTSVDVDEAFARVRDRLHSFAGVRPRREPASFVGELRPYQRDGLGWLNFLDEFGFGGCLADDMGLGKTIQVLAWLETRRNQRPANSEHKPSLVVVPRSLVFNWIEEARRFTPELRILNYTGLDRAASREHFDDFDVVVTTYGTLRRDIVQLREVEFDYAILDEAQAIKNSASQASKACRLLRAGRRLAMTGTPVENHLGELWALFEFLNPGMLGRDTKLHELFAIGRRSRIALSADDSESAQRANLALLNKALRPFLLRRTKQQVLTELPPKTEQTLYCELERGERKLYDELREHYRQLLLERVEKVGLNKSKVHVLEALLRLRQAACHPGLLDKSKATVSSSKLDTLLEQLEEVIAEGHKALVFSQFTSLLSIVKHQLDKRRIVYEYLDGRTTKRQAKVERFQTDPDCPLFLISLKAGGLGLNLTAADYAFILDPWWNPAVEAQAIDRAHRMGQQRHVFAYRLIARDTIEEKILKLQDQKRGLADAIVSADKSLLQSLTAEDLQILLS